MNDNRNILHLPFTSPYCSWTLSPRIFQVANIFILKALWPVVQIRPAANHTSHPVKNDKSLWRGFASRLLIGIEEKAGSMQIPLHVKTPVQLKHSELYNILSSGNGFIRFILGGTISKNHVIWGLLEEPILTPCWVYCKSHFLTAS